MLKYRVVKFEMSHGHHCLQICQAGLWGGSNSNRFPPLDGKAKRYGEEFCALIKRHCEENEIERPDDFRVRTVVNKSKIKVSIIQAIDRKVALDDLAISKGVEFEELLDELESIVYSGTKLNIDYFLEEIMDEENVDEIYSYFKSSDTDNLDDAMSELGAEYSEEEVRLVRVKFISEMAN